ncbi:MAG: hypothetical protein ACRDZW_02710 [Acidimicrobiales bacterium]
MDIADFQRLMVATYGARDRHRGRPATVAWRAEEVGDQLGLLLDDAASRYADGCPRCDSSPCRC